MDNGIHFISGLPRSGSTLLASILRQNPRFSAEMSSPMSAMFMALQGSMSPRNETAVFINESQKRVLLRGLFDGYYHETHPEKVVFDTNRLWCAKLPTLAQLYPDAKNHLLRPPYQLDHRQHRAAGSRKRLRSIRPVQFRTRRHGVQPGGAGGGQRRHGRICAGCIEGGFFGEQADRIILVDYEALTRTPASTIAAIYKFIGEPPFKHDFNNVEYSADDFDLRLGTPNCTASSARFSSSNGKASCRPSFSPVSPTTPSGSTPRPISAA